MKRMTRIHLFSVLHCAVLIALNWFWSARYSRQEGVTSESVSPVALAFILSACVVAYFTFRCIRLAAFRLERGERVPPGSWIQSWSVILYAVPLLFHKVSTSSWIEGDGAYSSATTGYGHELSPFVFLFAVIGLLLGQVSSRLKTDRGKSQTHRPSPRSTALRPLTRGSS